MIKAAQYSSLVYQPQLGGRTLSDLYMAIRGDLGLTESEKRRLILQINDAVGTASPNTPISALMMSGLGGVIGWLISRYFGMGMGGGLLSTLVGAGIGKAINTHMNEPDPYPGWRLL